MAETVDIKVRTTGVCKSFGTKQILHDVDLEIPTDKKTVLIGPAASGKTVLMKCLAGISQLDAGSIEIDGAPVPKAGGREHVDLMKSVGVLFQEGGLFDSLSIWENISFKLLHNFGISRDKAKQIAIEKLAMVRLPAPTADLLPSEISGGMQKRVGIARALAGDPSLLLLDEPTAGLDPITTSAINKLIDNSIHEIGATVLSITSDMHSARTDYDYLYMLNEGAVVWHGPTSEIDSAGNAYVHQLIEGHADGPIKMRLRARA
jgi:phospholipid/cholesterol/gamma-HCH transport system ATP-binding protein